MGQHLNMEDLLTQLFLASFPNVNISRVSLGYLVVINSDKAIATFFAGVICLHRRVSSMANINHQNSTHLIFL